MCYSEYAEQERGSKPSAATGRKPKDVRKDPTPEAVGTTSPLPPKRGEEGAIFFRLKTKIF